MALTKGLFLTSSRGPVFTGPSDDRRLAPKGDRLSVLKSARLADRRTLGQIWHTGIEFRGGVAVQKG